MNVILLLTYFFLTLSSAFAEAPPKPDPLLEAPEALVLEKDPETPKTLFIIGGVLEFPVYSFYLGSPRVNGLAYVPNVPPRLGPRILYKRLGAKFTFALPLPSKENKRRGKSEQQNTTLSFYWKQHALDFYYQSFKGFYMSSPLLELRANRQNRFTQLPEARSSHWGVNWYYNSNPGQFSLNSAFDSTEFELKRGASWVYIPFFRHWKIDLGDEIIKGSKDDSPDTLPDLAAGEFNSLGGSFAYAYTWTYDKYYASALGGLGPALQYQKYEDGDRLRRRIYPAAKLNLNGSVGIKRKDQAFGANFILDSIYTRINGLEVYTSLVSGELFYNRSF